MELLNEFLPKLPKRWKTLLALYVAYRVGAELMLPKKGYKDEVFVITGAGSGLGRLMALKTAKRGAQVALVDINEPAVQEVKKEVEALGTSKKVECYVCNVADREAIYRVMKQIEEDFKRVDVLINNAGIVGGKTILEADDNRMDLTMKVNSLALIYVTKALLPGMLERNHGHIINIASSAGRVGVPGLVDYCASKYAAVGFDESLRQELNKLGSKVRTLCVCPGYISTGMFKGAKLRPRLEILSPIVNLVFPVMEPDYITDEILWAYERSHCLLVRPRMNYTTTMLRALLPPTGTDWILELLGVTRSMDLFEQTRKF